MSIRSIQRIVLTFLCLLAFFSPVISWVIPITTRTSLKSLNCVVTGNNEVVAPVEPAKVRIGSQPQFSIEGDSTIETPYQRGVLGFHFLLTAANLAVALHTPEALNPLTAIISVILSVILGDLGTGIFHWSVDNYGSIKTPIVGTVCAAFQGHHDTPWTITFRSFANNVYKICYGSIPALALLLLLHPSPSLRLFFTLFSNWWVISQELHKYAHTRNPPRTIAILQDTGFILSRKEHGLHHSAPYEGHYCILTGVCNPVLDKTKFFRWLEKVVYMLTGEKDCTTRIF